MGESKTQPNLIALYLHSSSEILEAVELLLPGARGRWGGWCVRKCSLRQRTSNKCLPEAAGAEVLAGGSNTHT